MEVALAIARSGAVGVSRDDLAGACGLSSETLEDLVAALVAAGQVVVVRVNGERVFRAAWRGQAVASFDDKRARAARAVCR